VLLLVLPIPIGWVFTLLLHACLKTVFWLLSTKDKLIYLLSNTWVTIPVRRMEDRHQRHKGRETFFALLLAGFNLVGTFVALAIPAQHITVLTSRFFSFPSLFFYLAGCGLLLLFEKTVHPWRHLGKERESHFWGKLQGTKRGIEAEPTVWDQEGRELEDVDDEQQQHSLSNQEQVNKAFEEGSSEDEKKAEGVSEEDIDGTIYVVGHQRKSQSSVQVNKEEKTSEEQTDS